MSTIVAVFVCNKPYFHQFLECCKELVENGNFQEDIVLIIGNDLDCKELRAEPTIMKYGVQVVKFPEIDFPSHVMNVIKNLKTGDDRHLTKLFHWHKLNILRSFFKKWNYVFYLDSNFHIKGDITPILDQREKYKIVAYDDHYGRNHMSTLEYQFDMTNELFTKLSEKYNMRCRYFRSGLLLFDTDLITETTFWEIQDLVLRYPCCGNNDQGFLSLYFCSIKKCWKPLIPIIGSNMYYHCGPHNKNILCVVCKSN